MQKFLEDTWCGIQWTQWIPFESPDILTLPTGPGVYRIKATGIDELFYVGQTGRNLQERLLALIQNTLQNPEQMPYNDPHTAAPSLWSWHNAEGYRYECSVASVPTTISTEKREAFESSLLWRYRLQAGTSTRCNHGRFHPRYIKSSNQRNGRRGRRLRDDEANRPTWGPSYPALPAHNRPENQDWMTLQWTELLPFEQQTFPHQSVPGVCKLLDSNNHLVCVEVDQDIQARLIQFNRRKWTSYPLFFSIVTFVPGILPYQLLEIKNDLISGYYDLTRKPPLEQLRFN
jgi:hypothetical protein